MNFSKVFVIGILMAAICMGIPAEQVLGGEPPPGTDYKIVGPTMWGVCVAVDCSNNPQATLRVKKIDDCNVDTDPQVIILTAGCPVSEADVLYYKLDSGSVFGLPCVPIITKVKNFKIDGDLISFDVQIQFVVGNTDARTECQLSP